MKMRAVFCLIYGTVILAVVGLITHELTVNETSGINIFASLILIAGLLIEAILSETGMIDGNEDSGIVSALLYGGAVLTIALCRMLFNFMIFDGPVRILLVAAGCICFVAGVLLRYVSRVKLGKYFSYALRIEKEHELIDSGVYSTIRHPAYLGAIMTLFGVTLMFGAWLGIIIVFGGFIFTINRIKREEIILQNYFGLRYEHYMLHTNRLIPKIY